MRSILQSGDAITSVAGVQLEPGAWDDALRQVREALKPRPEPRELQFVRVLDVPTQLDLTKNKAFRDRVKLPANMRAENKSSKSISVGAEFIEALHKNRKEEVQLFPALVNWFSVTAVGCRKKKKKSKNEL